MSTFSWSYKADERPSARIAARPTVIGGTCGAEYDVCLLRYGQRTQGRSTQATILSTRFLLPRSARSSTMPTARSLCGRCRMTSVWPCAIPTRWCSCYRPADSELQHFFSAFQGLVEATVSRGDDGHSKGYGFVVFETAQYGRFVYMMPRVTHACSSCTCSQLVHAERPCE